MLGADGPRPWRSLHLNHIWIQTIDSTLSGPGQSLTANGVFLVQNKLVPMPEGHPEAAGASKMGGGCLVREKHKELVAFERIIPCHCSVIGDGGRGRKGDVEDEHPRPRHCFCRGTGTCLALAIWKSTLSPGCPETGGQGTGAPRSRQGQLLRPGSSSLSRKKAAGLGLGEARLFHLPCAGEIL